MDKINKGDNNVAPYTYLLKFKIDNNIKYYYGVRYSNVRANLTPDNDLFVHYFTSSSHVATLLEKGIYPFEIIIHKTFDTSKSACDFEVQFLSRIDAKNRKDFLNRTNKFNNSDPYCNKPRILSEETKRKISLAVSSRQSSYEWKIKKQEALRLKWQDPEFISYMKEKNDKFWYSEEGRKYVETRKPATLGHHHSDQTKTRMSETRKAYCKTIDCSAIAMKRPRYVCPVCNKTNLDGGNFNRHMRNHGWSTQSCIEFKESFLVQETR